MNSDSWSKLSSIAGIISSIAILITLLFLSIQTSQNTELLELQITNSQREARITIQLSKATDERILEIISKAISGEELTFEENRRIVSFADAMFSSLEWEYISYINNRTNFPIAAVIGLFQTEPPWVDQWNSLKFIYREDFVLFMDANIVSEI